MKLCKFSILLVLLMLPLGTARSAQFPNIELEPVVTSPELITYLTHAGDERLFLVEKRGRIMIIQDGEILEEPFLDIISLVYSSGSEQGLLSVAFDPADPNKFYVNYTNRPNGDTVVARYHVSDNLVDMDSAEILLTIEQPARNHNGGQLQFGPDGYLYIGMGDGGSGGDPWDNAENLEVLLGKMLRIDVSGQETYAIPEDNPFVDDNRYRPEIWAYGLRNPWRFSFDRETGDLYIADVGQNQFEEINFQFADSVGGENYGWNATEGFDCFEIAGCDTSAITLPVSIYSHNEGCSVTGGYVYRGSEFPALQGIYLYADYCSGVIWGMTGADAGSPEVEVLLNTDLSIASFGEDAAGELYVLDLSGGIYHIVVN